MSMEFWGAEVKSGEPLKVELGGDDNVILHLSQAALGEAKKDKGNENIYLYAKVGEKKLVIGTLSSEKFPQLTFDLVFEKKFELSHNWKNGSVYFTGYKTFLPNEDSTDSDSEKGFQYIGANIEPRTQAEQATKPDATAAKQVTIVEPNKDAKLKEKVDNTDEDESESSDDSFTSSGSSDEDDDGDVKTDEESEDDEESSEEDEDTPKKAEASKKRPLESANKTPVADKKGKFVTPEKTDGKKGGVHVATPHPSKLARKTPANNDQAKQQTPKSGGANLCKLCNRSFSSEIGLQSHTKAKHSEVK